MTAYVSPQFGNDETAQIESREFPFKTPKAANEAIQARVKEIGGPTHGHRIVETHRPPPAAAPAPAPPEETL